MLRDGQIVRLVDADDPGDLELERLDGAVLLVEVQPRGHAGLESPAGAPSASGEFARHVAIGDDRVRPGQEAGADPLVVRVPVDLDPPDPGDRRPDLLPVPVEHVPLDRHLAEVAALDEQRWPALEQDDRLQPELLGRGEVVLAAVHHLAQAAGAVPDRGLPRRVRRLGHARAGRTRRSGAGPTPGVSASSVVASRSSRSLRLSPNVLRRWATTTVPISHGSPPFRWWFRIPARGRSARPRPDRPDSR